MMKRILKRSVVLMGSAVLCASCATTVKSPTGNPAPGALEQPIPKTNTVLVVSAVAGDASVERKGADLYDSKTVTIKSLPLNAAITQSAAAKIQQLGYPVQTVTLNPGNPLYDSSIASPRSQVAASLPQVKLLHGPVLGSLSSSTKTDLMQLNQNIQAQTIILIARDTKLPFFEATCDSKGNASIVNAYRIYAIDTKDYDILTWETTTPTTTQKNSALCQDIQGATQNQMEQLLPLVQPNIESSVRETVKHIFTTVK